MQLMVWLEVEWKTSNMLKLSRRTCLGGVGVRCSLIIKDLECIFISVNALCNAYLGTDIEQSEMHVLVKSKVTVVTKHVERLYSMQTKPILIIIISIRGSVVIHLHLLSMD